MLVQITTKTLSQFIVRDSSSVWRVGDWYARHCPSCHNVGHVGVYEGREIESVKFISRHDWVCARCDNIRTEVERALVERG